MKSLLCPPHYHGPGRLSQRHQLQQVVFFFIKRLVLKIGADKKRLFPENL
jgi:hypothetical protein